MKDTITCPHCGRSILYSASKCDGCRKEISESDKAKVLLNEINNRNIEDSAYGYLGCVVAILIIAMCVWLLSRCEFKKPEDSRDIAYQYEGTAQIKAMMRDPNSAVFSGIKISRKGGAPVICGKVNGKNGFGGMTGYRRFISAPGVISVIEGENMTNYEFSGSWEQFCS